MKIRYFEEREGANGPIFVVNVPSYVKKATGYGFRSFGDRQIGRCGLCDAR